MTGIAPSPIRPPIRDEPAPSLETQLGDPFADGVLTFDAMVAREDSSRLTGAVREICDAWGVGAALVPHELGGRRASATELVSGLRPLFRRDVSLAVDLVAAPLAVMDAVLAAGDAGRRADTARRVASGERMGAVLAGADSLAPAGGIRVSAPDGAWMADGETPLVAGADASVLWALPVRGAGGGEALALCETDQPGVDIAPWIETVGLRGTRFGVASLTAVPLSPTEVLATEPGSTALERARTATAAILSALAIAAVDTAVHLAVPYAEGRRLYRGTVLDIPHARSLLADVHTDLLIADALAARAVRSLDAGAFDVFAASAGAYLVPQLLGDAMRALSVLFGSTFYARVEPYAVFETFVRDVGSLSLLGLGTPRALTPCVAALGQWADAAPGGAEPFGDRRADLVARVRSADSSDSAATRRLAREAAILATADACAELHGAASGPATDEWRDAAFVRLGTRLTGRKASLSEASIESAVDDLTLCVESSRSVTLERVPLFGRGL